MAFPGPSLSTTDVSRSHTRGFFERRLGGSEVPNSPRSGHESETKWRPCTTPATDLFPPAREPDRQCLGSQPMLIHVVTIAVSAFSLTATGALLLQARRILQRRSSADVSITYFLITSGNMALWLAYGWLKQDPVLYLLNMVGLVCAITVVIAAIRFRHPRLEGLEEPGGFDQVVDREGLMK